MRLRIGTMLAVAGLLVAMGSSAFARGSWGWGFSLSYGSGHHYYAPSYYRCYLPPPVYYVPPPVVYAPPPVVVAPRVWVPGHYVGGVNVWVPGYWDKTWVQPTYETRTVMRGNTPVEEKVLARDGYWSQQWRPGYYKQDGQQVWVPGHWE